MQHITITVSYPDLMRDTAREEADRFLRRLKTTGLEAKVVDTTPLAEVPSAKPPRKVGKKKTSPKG